ncbi:uncharacterized protein BJX67DRAFT_255094 [Aspergillus lucknowensis]|uniref:Uncharacterized protein n=1 Tax=Aspergillus lucknowensis TaxID=176173 RepID=A0ABR4LGU2_9EURO
MSTSCWGRRFGYGRVACSYSKPAHPWLLWDSRERHGRLRRLQYALIRANGANFMGLTYNCSTSDRECNHGPCGRSRRRSSKSADGRQSHHRNHLRSCRLAGSFWRCAQRDRICSTPGRQPGARFRPLGGIRERCDRHRRNDSRTFPWELQCIHDLH